MITARRQGPGANFLGMRDMREMCAGLRHHADEAIRLVKIMLTNDHAEESGHDGEEIMTVRDHVVEETTLTNDHVGKAVRLVK